MNQQDAPIADKPSLVAELEKVFGGPSQAAFGTSVFFEPAAEPHADLDQQALAKYKYFVGENWDRFGADNWLGTWSLVSQRQPGEKPDFLGELSRISDAAARLSASTMVDCHEDPSRAKEALVKAFDDGSVKDLRVYRIGDGEAMSGVLIGAVYPEGAAFLVFLMD